MSKKQKSHSTEKVYWTYEAALNSKGTRVVLSAQDVTNASQYLDGKTDQGVLFYDPDDISLEDVNKAMKEGETSWHHYITQRFTGGKAWCTTDQQQDDARSKGWTELASTVNRTRLVNVEETAIPYEMVVTMDDLTFNVNNQWSDGDGSSNWFSSTVDGLVDSYEGVVSDKILNTGDFIEKMGNSARRSDILRLAKMTKQQKYRSSTTFMKKYQGSALSLPISVRRTFVTDDYYKDISEELALVSKWAAPTERPISSFFSEGDSPSGPLTDEDRRKMESTRASLEFIKSAADTAGGLLQRAPLGYIYNATEWVRMLGEDYQQEPFYGTIKLTHPSGLVLGGLLVADFTVSMSATQVMTFKGLRPLSITVMMQLVPARMWGSNDLMSVLQFKGIDQI